ncbi:MULTISPECIES: HD-GYP domain-containing protein [unclassified Oceanispirochaeta]|uniref:HD-GYP domain-containing protein n=1 Tax=unclassified Oceanispirochaeta TaxID=2635722 RepID=UPI000E0984EA|nr:MULTISPECIES: HD domain-containing phosphohydrolase [unclassified Oceanispirochaeta]MBF9015932.1 HD domain-containing protein [Oceanispirochaeta sp. M2]NPD72395.1 HD domain-containing protein [Oceanispirochaeta sp. M1]RDG32166.1 HD domain-containing protein [Oceanispirochaeta sp. M1]
MISFKKEKWIPVRKSNLKYYVDIDLFYRNKTSGEVLLYKNAGMHITDERLKDKSYTGDLYIRPEDKSRCLRNVHSGFSSNLDESMEVGVEKVKEELINIIDETLHEPRSGGLEVIPDTMDLIVDSYSRQPDVIKNLAKISHSDYTTTIHSLNVMALTVGYCFYTNKPFKTTVDYGLTALFHDIGKTEIPQDILSAPRPLSDYEFDTMKSHTLLGAEILQANSHDVHLAIPGALEHHEKLDGRGYPHGQKTISEIGQILAIIDSYEAITNDDRLYRSAMEPLDALAVLKEEVDKERLNKKIFENFAYSLTNFSGGRGGKTILSNGMDFLKV